MLKVISATIEGPDSDDDIRPEVNIEFKNESDRPVEFVSSKTLIFTGDGLLASSDSDENDDYIEPGEIWTGELRCSYFKSKAIESKRPKVYIEVLGCACNHHQLSSFELYPGSLVGLGEKTDLGDEISLLCLTVSTSVPDDDGDVTVEIKAVLNNASSSGLPKAEISGKIMRSGREVEEVSNYDPVPAGQLTILEASSYMKKRQLSSATIDVRLSIFPVVAREAAEAVFE
jgi:hypothetical protein